MGNDLTGPTEIERDQRGTRRDDGMWLDAQGFAGPFQPGVGPRNDPLGDFPTGPAVGEPLPPIVAPSASGGTVDVEALAAGGPAVVVFHRSAVW